MSQQIKINDAAFQREMIRDLNAEMDELKCVSYGLYNKSDFKIRQDHIRGKLRTVKKGYFP